jgi:hypothetical protein
MLAKSTIVAAIKSGASVLGEHADTSDAGYA